jgi:ubiquinone/menaquinone biosynthesis C-methylase UbiE
MTNLNEIRERLQATWAAGDFHQIGVESIIVGERVREQVGVRAGQRVLDVACGTGNTTLAAARRRARATGCDWVPALLERAEQRAKAEGLQIEWVKADAEELPFSDESFDVVLSTFGVMFAADQQRAADQLIRVCRPGGTIGLANWVSELFGDRVVSLRLSDHVWRTRFASFSEWLDLYRTLYGPTNRAFAALDGAKAAKYTRGLEEIIQRHNRATDGTIDAAYEYVNVVARRR